MIRDWLEANVDGNIKYTGNGKEAHFCCPFCGDTRYRMYVSLSTGAVFCHNCNFSGSVVALIQGVEGVSWSKALKIFNDVKGNLLLPENINRKLEEMILNSSDKISLEKRAIPLPEEFISLTPDSIHPVAKRALKYLHGRCITNKQILQHKFGYCVEGEYKNRIIIPITENGELRFWVARAIGTEAKLKEKSPSDEFYNISKSEVIFNIDTASKKYHSCVICEGIFDSLSFGDIGVSLLGKTLYEAQLNLLLDYKNFLTDGVYIAIDWDARDKALDMANTLSQYFKTRIITIPEEFDDPNKYLQTHSRLDMWELIKNAEEFSEFSNLKKLFM